MVVQGFEVYLPAFGKGACDLIALKDSEILRVETKYVAGRRGSYEVTLTQVRPNLTAMRHKRFDSTKSDVLAVYIAPLDRAAFLPAAPLHDRTSISLRENMIDAYANLEGAARAQLPIPYGNNQFSAAARRAMDGEAAGVRSLP